MFCKLFLCLECLQLRQPAVCVCAVRGMRAASLHQQITIISCDSHSLLHTRYFARIVYSMKT